MHNVLSVFCYYSIMMTSSNGNIFRASGPWCGEFTGDRWIPRTKTSDAELLFFLWSTSEKRSSKQWRRWWFKTPSCSLWRHCNVTSPDSNFHGAHMGSPGSCRTHVGPMNFAIMLSWSFYDAYNKNFNGLGLTHCDLVTPYGGKELGQHWFQ